MFFVARVATLYPASLWMSFFERKENGVYDEAGHTRLDPRGKKDYFDCTLLAIFNAV